MKKIEWQRDPAASGWRSRAFLEKGEVVAYDSGAWFVFLGGSYPDGRIRSVASAEDMEPDAKRAKRRALAVYEALTKRMV